MRNPTRWGVVLALLLTAALPLAAEAADAGEAPHIDPADDVHALQLEVLRLGDENATLRQGLKDADAEVARLRGVRDDLRSLLEQTQANARVEAEQMQRLYGVFKDERRAGFWRRIGCAGPLAVASDLHGNDAAGIGLACGFTF